MLRYCKMSEIFLVILLMSLRSEAAELLNNPDFESASLDPWNGNNCNLQLSQDAHSGTQSAYISARKAKWAGIEQMVDVEPDTRYVVRGFIKLINHKAGYIYHTVKIIIRSTISKGVYKYDDVAVQPWLQKDFGWTEIGADYRTRPGVTKIEVYIQIEEPEVNYLFDSASITKLADNNNWEQEANDYIEASRKTDLILKIPGFVRRKGYTVKIEQLKGKFAFGSVVGAEQIVDPDVKYKKYQDFFFNNFEWATIGNALKWKPMEKKQGTIDYEKPWKAIKVLREKGISIRGHNVFWAVAKHVPSWLSTTQNPLEVMKKRVKDVIQNTTGSLEHWDVDNEALHDDYFEQKLNNANISMDMFDWVNDEEPGVDLFLNEFAVVNKPLYTTAYKNQGKLFVNAGKPIYGMGIQSHFSSGNIDMTSLKYRLDKVAETGLPIWITELCIEEKNVTLKASAMRNVLTMYFGHPSVKGVVLWGFWDQKIWKFDSALATGDDVTPNAAGIQYQTLRGKTWRTNIDALTPTEWKTVVRAFQGDYKISIMDNLGVEKLTTTLTIGNGAKTVRVVRDLNTAVGLNIRIIEHCSEDNSKQ